MGDEEFTKWRSVTVPELKAFLGFHILMGINHLPSLDDYWRRDPLLHYAPIAGRITRDRFREVSRYLHFVNDSLQPRESPGYDRLGKVRPVINHLSTKFADLYQPHCEVAIDEAMIKLMKDLLDNGIYACGTARKDRKGFPSTLKEAKLSTRSTAWKIDTYKHRH